MRLALTVVQADRDTTGFELCKSPLRKFPKEPSVGKLVEIDHGLADSPSTI